MNMYRLRSTIMAIGFAALQNALADPSVAVFDWATVVNNGDYMPTDTCDPSAPSIPSCRTFNSYNQPSVNVDGLVVMRARSRGGQGQGQPVHGVYSRDMATEGPVVKILDRDTLVPAPNNRGAEFIEPPSFPRIDIRTDTIATRGNHQPVWKVFENGEIVEQLGTTGIYANPFGYLLTAASKLGSVPEFSFFEVPEAPGTPFDVFPGAPAVTNGTTIVFKGNYTVNNSGRTGVYYRRLQDAPTGGERPVMLIANNTDTLIPDTGGLVFGSTAPPSAARNHAVFAGFDDEDNPAAGGIYLAPLIPAKFNRPPKLKTLVGIGSRVPGEPVNSAFNRLGEGVSFDGRFVAFWGAWGDADRIVRLYCPDEGNKARIAYCKSDASGSQQDENGDWYQVRNIPENQGIFVHDTTIGKTFLVARTGENDFADFMYWNFSGRAPGVGEGEEGEEDGELARWRSSAFVAVSGRGGRYRVAFKGRMGDIQNQIYVDPVDGIYLGNGPKQPRLVTLVQTGMDGTLIDPEAVDCETGVSLPITELGIERDGFRDDLIVINASMGSEETGWAGIYMTRVR